MLSIQTPSILGKQREFAVKTEPLRSRGTQQENLGRGFEIDSVCAFEECFKTVDGRCEALC